MTSNPPPPTNDPFPSNDINPPEPTQELSESQSLAAFNLLKTSANSSFAIGDLDAALTGYERAMASLPASRSWELAVVRSNMGACYLRLEKWGDCVGECSKGMEEVEILEGDLGLRVQKEEEEGKEVKVGDIGKEERVLEVEDDDEEEDDGKEEKEKEVVDKSKEDDEEEEEKPEEKKKREFEVSRPDDLTKEDILRIKTKLLLRRAKARAELGGWADLHGAQEGKVTKCVDKFIITV
jgi:hypothetical protein